MTRRTRCRLLGTHLLCQRCLPIFEGGGLRTRRNHRNISNDAKPIAKHDTIPVEVSAEEVKRYYTEIERYDWVTDTKYPEKLFHNLRAKKVASLINALVQNGDEVILDIGCGTGLITHSLCSTNITALDINKWALERAKLHTSDKNINFVPGDAENLPFASNIFDIIVCTEVLEHLLRPDLALREINRVMKPGALFIGSVPSKSLIWKYRKHITATSPAAEPFHNNYTIREFKSILADFDIISMRRCIFGLNLVFSCRKTNDGCER